MTSSSLLLSTISPDAVPEVRIPSQRGEKATLHHRSVVCGAKAQQSSVAARASASENSKRCFIKNTVHTEELSQVWTDFSCFKHLSDQFLLGRQAAMVPAKLDSGIVCRMILPGPVTTVLNRPSPPKSIFFTPLTLWMSRLQLSSIMAR